MTGMANRSQFWSLGLIKTLDDPKFHIISTECGVVIKDKYPKSKHHFLVLPMEDIPSVYDLNASHAKLLTELHLLAMNAVELTKLRSDDFQIGFHAKPSMQRLHLHVISRDFVSPWMKTKKHWNTHNTKLFIPYEDVFRMLEEDGKVRKPGNDELKELISTKLKCCHCISIFKTMSDLKNHLETHLDKP